MFLLFTSGGTVSPFIKVSGLGVVPAKIAKYFCGYNDFVFMRCVVRRFVCLTRLSCMQRNKFLISFVLKGKNNKIHLCIHMRENKPKRNIFSLKEKCNLEKNMPSQALSILKKQITDVLFMSLSNAFFKSLIVIRP